ncbi:MAG TPA: hypothetical protein VHA76_16560 [Solirubrobacterales bacterium]|nr:hypothetical protein [Solirubrobacterales bacterium]
MPSHGSIRVPVGVTAVLFSVAYFVSDAIEAAQGGFSTGQLWLTLVAEIAIPFFVVGLYLVQLPRIGRLGAWGAGGYAVAYVFFVWTVIYPLIHSVPDFDTLSEIFGVWMFLGGALMVIAGLAFGWATIRAAVLPRWSAICLMVGVVLVAATQGTPEGVQLIAAGVRDLGFAGMGAALLAPGMAVRPRLG